MDKNDKWLKLDLLDEKKTTSKSLRDVLTQKNLN